MTTNSPADPDRRFCLVAPTVTPAATAVPFVASMAPSEPARAIVAPVGVDLQGIKEGELKTIAWRGQPAFVI